MKVEYKMTSGELVCRRRGWSTGGQMGDGVQDDNWEASVQEEGLEYRRTDGGWSTR